ncbi:hypothetical protein KAX35_01615 [candidate division WOR-3 bacterium]|nr:hypothetical protein [candidate division WOR-3 bacterium]
MIFNMVNSKEACLPDGRQVMRLEAGSMRVGKDITSFEHRYEHRQR